MRGVLDLFGTKNPDLGTKTRAAFFKDRYFSCFALGFLSLKETVKET